MNRKLTAIIEREDDGYVTLCPEVDVVSQGETVADARDSLKEALTLTSARSPRVDEPEQDRAESDPRGRTGVATTRTEE